MSNQEARLPRLTSFGENNISELERYASLAVGGLLIVNGLRQRSWMSLGAGLLVGGSLAWRGATGHCAVYQAMDMDTATQKDGTAIREHAPEVVATITVGRGAEELYNLWRGPETLAQIMSHFAEVSAIEGPKLTHWRVHSPIGKSVEWDSELTVEKPGEELSWASRPGTLLPNEGSVYFKPAEGEWGTEVRVRFRFEPPLGVAGDTVAKALDFIPKKIAEVSLRHLKSLAETGEIPTLAQNPSGRGDKDLV